MIGSRRARLSTLLSEGCRDVEADLRGKMPMNRATPQLRRIAERLLATGLLGTGSAETAPATMFPMTDKLRSHLEILMGKGGVRALLARALVLAAAEILWLRDAQIDANGDLRGLETRVADLDPAQFLEARVVLLARLLGLLVALIGPSLTSRLIGEVWPEIPLGERNFGKEDDREEGR